MKRRAFQMRVRLASDTAVAVRCNLPPERYTASIIAPSFSKISKTESYLWLSCWGSGILISFWLDIKTAHTDEWLTWKEIRRTWLERGATVAHAKRREQSLSGNQEAMSPVVTERNRELTCQRQRLRLPVSNKNVGLVWHLGVAVGGPDEFLSIGA